VEYKSEKFIAFNYGIWRHSFLDESIFISICISCDMERTSTISFRIR